MSLFHLLRKPVELPGNGAVADGIGNDGHGTEYGDAAGGEDREDAGKTGHGRLVEQRTDDRHPQLNQVAQVGAGDGFAVPVEHEKQNDSTAEKIQPVMLQPVVHGKTYPGRQGKLQPGALENTDKFGDNKGQQHKKGQAKSKHNHFRVAQRGLNILPQTVLMFTDIDETIEDFGKRTAHLSGPDQAAVERWKDMALF